MVSPARASDLIIIITASTRKPTSDVGIGVVLVNGILEFNVPLDTV